MSDTERDWFAEPFDFVSGQRCAGDLPLSMCQAIVDLPGDQLLMGAKPGWHCANCWIAPGARGPLGRKRSDT